VYLKQKERSVSIQELEPAAVFLLRYLCSFHLGTVLPVLERQRYGQCRQFDISLRESLQLCLRDDYVGRVCAAFQHSEQRVLQS